MNCREYEKQIPDFLGRNMTYLQMKDFIQHIRSCEKCKEELVIHFLVEEGIASLEEGDAFDLQKELDFRLKEAERKVDRNDTFLDISMVVEAVMMVAVVVSALMIVW